MLRFLHVPQVQVHAVPNQFYVGNASNAARCSVTWYRRDEAAGTHDTPSNLAIGVMRKISPLGEWAEGYEGDHLRSSQCTAPAEVASPDRLCSE
jgi:hypothetical protein